MPPTEFAGVFCHDLGFVATEERVFPRFGANFLYSRGLGKKRSNAFCLSPGGLLL